MEHGLVLFVVLGLLLVMRETNLYTGLTSKYSKKIKPLYGASNGTSTLTGTGTLTYSGTYLLIDKENLF